MDPNRSMTQGSHRVARRAVLGMLAAAGIAPTVATTVAAAPRRPVGTSTDDVETLLATMSREQKVGQLFVPVVYGARIDQPHRSNTTTTGADTIGEVLDRYHVGGVIYFAWSGNLDSPAQVARLSEDMQRRAVALGDVPLTISIDEEEGVVTRLPQPSTAFPGTMALGATRSADHAATAASMTGRELRAVGVNQNYAPVADVNVEARNPVIGVRSFGSDPDLVGDLVEAQVAAFQASGVSSTVKHFPGHGNTAVDSHHGLPVIDLSLEEFESVDLPPFLRAVEAGVDAIMTAHIVVPALDDSGLPATLSHPILTGLLRERIGFEGVIVTDALHMEGVRGIYPDDRLPVEILKAGGDQMLMPVHLGQAIDAVLAALESGELTEERIDDSVRRILVQKQKRNLLADPFVDLDAVEDEMNRTEHREASALVSESSMTLLVNEGDVLPLDVGSSVLVTGWGGDVRLETIADELRSGGAKATVIAATAADPAAIAAAAGHDAVLVLTQSGGFDTPEGQVALVEGLVSSGVPVIHVAVRNPYDAVHLPGTAAALVTYGYAEASLRAAAQVVLGSIGTPGRLPVALPDTAGTGERFAFGFGLDLPVIPVAPLIHDRTGKGQDRFEVPDDKRVSYLVDGEPVPPGVHRMVPGAHVVAVPRPGSRLAEGAVGEWQISATSEATPQRRNS
jgi:beta-N-acetylhexosaminidase